MALTDSWNYDNRLSTTYYGKQLGKLQSTYLLVLKCSCSSCWRMPNTALVTLANFFGKSAWQKAFKALNKCDHVSALLNALSIKLSKSFKKRTINEFHHLPLKRFSFFKIPHNRRDFLIPTVAKLLENFPVGASSITISAAEFKGAVSLF